jgi:hypothetical protein
MPPDSQARSPVERQWIKANVLGAAVNGAGGVVVYGLSKLFGVDDAEATQLALTVFSAFTIIVTSAALALYGFLVAVVLRQKVRKFPMQNWLILYALFGVALGALTAYTSTFPDDVAPSPASDQSGAGIILGGVIGGAIVGFFAGSLQALILRDVARDLTVWIRYSALAGTALTVLVASSLIWPLTGFANELFSEIAAFASSIVGAVLMLPAVTQLESP